MEEANQHWNKALTLSKNLNDKLQEFFVIKNL